MIIHTNDEWVKLLVIEDIYMTPTNHFSQRMNQRGHTKAMIELALLCGELSGDKCIANKKQTQKFIESTDRKIKKLNTLKQKNLQLLDAHLVDLELEELQEQRRTAMKLLDKGGITIVYEGDYLITVYNTNSFKRC